MSESSHETVLAQNGGENPKNVLSESNRPVDHEGNENKAELNPDNVINNSQKKRYEFSMDGHIGYLSYKLTGDRIDLKHTIVPQELGGRGIGTLIIKTALEDARKMQLKVIPTCHFVRSYIKRHQEYLPLVAEESRYLLKNS